MEPLTLGLFIIGIGLLVAGAEGLVRGASHLAVSVGISPLVVGLTVVAFGTSAPEFAVSVSSALGGNADIAIGNVVGSNIFNVLFILGLASLITPLVVSQQLVRLEVPIMVGVSVLLLLFSLNGSLGRLEAAVLAAGIITYTVWAIRKSRRESREVQAEYAEAMPHGEGGAPLRPTPRTILLDFLFILGGLGLLLLGTRWFVDGAVSIAESLGVSELVIGLTVVAAGTSMPEVATSVLASIRGERDIAVGNVVGSNIFNILAVLGFSGLIADGGIAVADAALSFDMPVMVGVAIACFPIFFTGRRIDRWEGALFLAYYAAYTVYLILNASGHDALRAYGAAMIGFVIPLTAVTLVVLAVRAHRRGPVQHAAS